MTIKRVFALGNGESRKDLNLTKLSECGIIYGCNALYRDFRPDALVAVDPVMKEEIWETDYLLENKAYFKGEPTVGDNRGLFYWDEDSPKRAIDSSKIIKRKFPDDSIRTGYSSGPTSVLVACIEEKPDEVYLIGHDLSSPVRRFNNIYKDSQNYGGAQATPTPTGNWILQLRRTFDDFGVGHNKHLVQFYMVSNTKEEVKDWKLLSNIYYITCDEMWKRLNR